MFSRTLVTATVLVLFCTLGLGCTATSSDFHAGPLSMPVESNVGEIGRSSGLPFTVEVASNTRVGNSLPLEIKINNVSNHDWGYAVFKYLNPDRRFAIWILYNKCQVPLTECGEEMQPRYTVRAGFSSGPPGTLAPGRSKIMRIDLAKYFQITQPGEYTAIVEEGPVWFEESESCRELEAAKTSFVIIP